jgi:ABC-type taurine transport system ATPase subunit
MPVAYEVGILAGDRFIPTLLPGLKPPHDGRVTVESTRLAGMKAHTVVHCMHSFLPWHPRVGAQAIQFLAEGEFLP